MPLYSQEPNGEERGEQGAGINPWTISAYGSHSRRRIRRSNPPSSRSCHSRRTRHNPAARRSRNLGYRILDSSSYYSLDSNFDLGLQNKPTPFVIRAVTDIRLCETKAIGHGNSNSSRGVRRDLDLLHLRLVKSPRDRLKTKEHI